MRANTITPLRDYPIGSRVRVIDAHHPHLPAHPDYLGELGTVSGVSDLDGRYIVDFDNPDLDSTGVWSRNALELVERADTAPVSDTAETPTEDTRNVTDFYKRWETEAIVADLETRRTALVNVCVNVNGDFNKAAIIRANNAFTGARVIITERRRFNKRGTVGTHHYEHVEFARDTLAAIADLIADGYTVYPVDNTPEFDPQVITAVTFPPKTAFLYGEEGLGLDAEVIAACNARPVYIAQHGSVRSLNVGQAAAIAMYEFERQHPRDDLFAADPSPSG